MACKVLKDRSELLLFLAEECGPNQRVAEVGVETGQFSREIMDVVKPAELHLIDMWKFIPGSRDGSNVEQSEQERRYKRALARFTEAELIFGRVVIHRNDSVRALYRYKDGYFDWIYIDADHRYDGVLGDLHAAWPKVRRGGILAGHDFSFHTKFFGTIPAVLDFMDDMRMHRPRVVAVTAETYASYAIYKP